ncbi:MAG: winged helix-turn-helix transcriptional regulator [Bacilli bacterium]|nr:winged helix-turn-helix transcriptional regulator [Bacilli bacterium]
MNNPFSMTFGLEPTNLIKRITESEKIISEFSNDNPSNHAYVITGLRGSGKTVLMSYISSHFKEMKDWIVVDPGVKDNIIENVASELYENGKLKKLFIKSEFDFSFKGISFSIHGEEPVSSAYALLKKMLTYLKKKGKNVLITIDEVDNSEQMKRFVEAYQSLLREKFPVRLLMTGLFENIAKLQDDKSLTFLYRAPKVLLGPLNEGIIKCSYKELLGVDDELALKLTRLSKGYAYAYQTIGYLMFEKGGKSITEMFLAEYEQYLVDYVYEKIVSELSKTEKKILANYEDDKDIKLSEIAARANMDEKTISVYRDRLIKKGIIRQTNYGYTELTLPRFAHYLKLVSYLH